MQDLVAGPPSPAPGRTAPSRAGNDLDGRGLSRGKTQTTSRRAMGATGTGESGWQRDRRVDVLPGD